MVIKLFSLLQLCTHLHDAFIDSQNFIRDGDLRKNVPVPEGDSERFG